MGVSVLAVVDHVQAVNPTLGSFTIHRDANIVTRKLGAKRYRGRIELTFLTKIDFRCRHVERLHTFPLQLVVPQLGARSDAQFGHSTGEKGPASHAGIAFNYRSRTILFSDDKHAG